MNRISAAVNAGFFGTSRVRDKEIGWTAELPSSLTYLPVDYFKPLPKR